MKNVGLGLAAGMTVLGDSFSARAAEAGKKRPEVVAVYYPHWHKYDHGISWKGEGWTEWEGMKAFVQHFHIPDPKILP